MKHLADLEKKEGMDLAQKLKLKWGLEGDENSKFFHSMLNKKRRKEAINGVLEDGTWISDMGQVKDRFCTFFHEKFKHFNGNRMVTPSARMMKLSDEQVRSPVSFKDYRPISLIGIQYKIVAKLLANRMVKVIDDLVHPVQSAFVKGRQILDGPMVVNEVIEWYKKKNKKCRLLKVDLDKAYDSVSWDYLLQIIFWMGFNEKWIQWIRACLISSRASVLINGSPTNEFQLQRSLRQGDPLSPFLFILAMEGLHVAMEDAVEHCIFHDIRVGPGEALIFHLFYADGAMFMGEWDAENVSNLITILNCFYLVSGCSAASLPFTYLGLPVGCNMRRISSWEDMILKVQKKLSTWKIKLLSIGVRLTLIKSVLGSLGVYFMSMFKMPEVVNKKMKALRAQFL
ncbi:putative RNA-directed DNA polymerase, eukaryota, reverse transcriptase zinc-binding domain protein [Tanacetum coccineum]